MQVTVLNKEFDFASLRSLASSIALVGSLAAVSTHAGDLFVFHIECLPAIDDVIEKRILELARTGKSSAHEMATMFDVSRTRILDLLRAHDIRLPGGRRRTHA